MAITAKAAFDTVRDIATHAVEKASDIVVNAGDILRGDISGGTSGIIQNSLDIATHTIDRTKEFAVEALEQTKRVVDDAAHSRDV